MPINERIIVKKTREAKKAKPKKTPIEPAFQEALENRIFTTKELAQVTGIKERDIVNLADRKILVPEHHTASGTGTRRLYSWKNCLELEVVAVMADLGMGMQHARSVLDRMTERDLWKRVWKENLMIVIVHSRVPEWSNYQFLFYKDAADLLRQMKKPSWLTEPTRRKLFGGRRIVSDKPDGKTKTVRLTDKASRLFPDEAKTIPVGGGLGVHQGQTMIDVNLAIHILLTRLAEL